MNLRQVYTLPKLRLRSEAAVGESTVARVGCFDRWGVEDMESSELQHDSGPKAVVEASTIVGVPSLVGASQLDRYW